MIAFLKRRWVLLSCAGVLLACSLINRGVLLWDSVTSYGYFGASKGRLSIGVAKPVKQGEAQALGASFHEMMSTSAPGFHRAYDVNWLSVPIWLPLSAVLGWIVIRELRWREKRAKSKEPCRTN